jgi:hypothetical protein
MGNHDVGRAMAAAARTFWIANGDAPPTKEKALAALDAAAEHFHGADAEFDDELYDETPLSRLVAIAFDATPEEIKNRDHPEADNSAWYDGPLTRFSERYRFC